MDIKEWAQQISQGQTTALAQAITLVESLKPEDWKKSKQLLGALNFPKKATHRVGFSGPPGVGKSTLIEKLGLEIINSGAKVAVLAIDPSSVLSGGSILGDKTRMEELSRSPQAFVRPSPTRGHLGGVTSRMPGVILLCEAAGFDWILVESVGVGQSEVELSSMVDLFTLISQPGAGDELQGIKKGILEYVDMILVNKVDRDPALVNSTKQQLLAASKILHSKQIEIISTSGLTGEGVKEFFAQAKNSLSGRRDSQRESFASHWFESLVYSEFRNRLQSNPQWKSKFEAFSEKVKSGQSPVIEAVDDFLEQLGLGQ